MNAHELHIAEIGEYFINTESFDFLSEQNLLEYDFIVMDSESLINTCGGRSLKRVEKRISDLRDYIKTKNIAIPIFLPTYNSFYLASGNNSLEFTISKLLGEDCIEEAAIGKKIEFKPDTLFNEILKENAHYFEYVVCFSKHPGISVGNAKSKSSIGFYTQDFVFLPGIIEDHDIDSEYFLSALYKLCKHIRKQGDENVTLPKWANHYLLPGEMEDKLKLEQITMSIAQLEKEKTTQEQSISTYSALKQLWSGSGFALEKAVKGIFIELGFAVSDLPSGREDIIMKWKEQVVIAEIKGLTKSAAEKNAAQLEKWVSSYYSENDTAPKGLLIVNTFRETSLDQRTQASFPSQMLPYCNSRGHCLLTTIQLCCLMLYIRKNPAEKESEIHKLLTTVGVYKNFNNWQEYISTDNKLIKSKKM